MYVLQKRIVVGVLVVCLVAGMFGSLAFASSSPQPQDYTPYRAAYSSWGTTYYWRGYWNEHSINWFKANQRYLLHLLRHRLWWEAEMRASNNNIGQWIDRSVPVFTSSNLPNYYSELDAEEISQGTRRPDNLVPHQFYWGNVSFSPAPNQPSTFFVIFESELTDWSAFRPFWHTYGTYQLPGEWWINYP